MDECDILHEWSLLCTNTLVFTWFCNCKFLIKKIGKYCLPNRVDIRMCIWIRDICFVFVYLNSVYLNSYSYSSKNVVKGVIRFHVNPIRFHRYVHGTVIPTGRGHCLPKNCDSTWHSFFLVPAQLRASDRDRDSCRGALRA
jgi:hypothetical protein